MHNEEPTVRIPVSRSGVCVVDGYGIKIRVERGRLVISDGLGPLRRESRFARATHGIRRLIILGFTGYHSFEATRWLADVGISFVHLDPDGRLLAASGGMGLDDPRLRRAQALAFGQPVGMSVARMLLGAKLDGQLRVAASLGANDEVRATIKRAAGMLRPATTPAELMIPEAAAAFVYWTALADVPVRWAKSDRQRVPEAWRMFGKRASPLTGNSRNASVPSQAVLNYCYSLLQAEARLACLAMGLDPGLGVLHADQRARDSLALDVMEAVRPDVEEFLLNLFDRRTFRWNDFLEGRDGRVRLVAPLTHELAETTTIWRSRLGPIVERVALVLVDRSGPVQSRLPSKLTQANRSAGRDRIRRRAPEHQRDRQAVATTCRTCGDRLVDTARRYCDACLPERIAEQRQDVLAGGVARLAELRAAGIAPAHTPSAQASRARKQTEHRRLAREWDGPAPDTAAFRREVLPGLVEVRATFLAQATGLSRPYCSAILRGERVPHPRHWQALRSLATKLTTPYGPREEMGGLPFGECETVTPRRCRG